MRQACLIHIEVWAGEGGSYNKGDLVQRITNSLIQLFIA